MLPVARAAAGVSKSQHEYTLWANDLIVEQVGKATHSHPAKMRPKGRALTRISCDALGNAFELFTESLRGLSASRLIPRPGLTRIPLQQAGEAELWLAARS